MFSYLYCEFRLGRASSHSRHRSNKFLKNKMVGGRKYNNLFFLTCTLATSGTCTNVVNFPIDLLLLNSSKTSTDKRCEAEGSSESGLF